MADPNPRPCLALHDPTRAQAARAEFERLAEDRYIDDMGLLRQAGVNRVSDASGHFRVLQEARSSSRNWETT